MARVEKGTALSTLIHPVSVEDFLRDAWGQDARHFDQGVGEAARTILSLADLEQLIATLNRPHEGWLHLGDGTRTALPLEMLDDDGMADLRKLRTAFQNGKTIYLTKAHRLSSRLNRLCRDLQLELYEYGIHLREPLSAHVFLTPPGAQGFALHHDEHASIIVQIEGSKDWNVYVSSEHAGSPGAVDRRSLGATAAHHFHLRAGDALYIPEWWPHEAKAGPSYSLHVTLRVFPLRWTDYLQQVASRDQSLSAPLPRYAMARADQLAFGLAARLDSAELRSSLQDQAALFTQLHPAPDPTQAGEFHGMVNVARIGPDTWLVRASDAACHLFDESDRVGLRFPGGSMRAPRQFRAVFEHLATSDRFRVSDLPTTDPAYDKLGIAKKVVECGLFRCHTPEMPCGAAEVTNL